MGNQIKFLQGLKIIDMTRVLAGPFASMILADLGAEVIKIEGPRNPDETRNYAPKKNGLSSYFESININKTGKCLDLESSTDRPELDDLIRSSDVIIHNFLPKVVDKLKLNYETLHEINRKLIYVSISAYSEKSKKFGIPGYDIIMQGETGLLSVTGMDEDNLCRVGNSTVDIYTGYMTVIMILSALLKKKTDENFDGLKINIPLFNCGIFSMTYLFPYFSLTSMNPSPLGISHPGIVPYQKFDTEDAPIIIAVANNNIWDRFVNIEYFKELSEDPRFATNEERVKNRNVLSNLIQKELMKNKSGFWVDIFQKMGIPSGKINKISDIVTDPEMIKNGDIFLQSIQGIPFVFPSFPVLINGDFIDFYKMGAPNLCEDKNIITE
ncbi:MAG: CaiB/BaiF CoA transferase family protein [Thermoplasmata archaeon]